METRITTPQSKLKRLIALSRRTGNPLDSDKAIAEAMGIAASQYSKAFGGSRGDADLDPPAGYADKLARAFTARGVQVHADFLFLPFAEFDRRPRRWYRSVGAMIR